MGRLVHKILDRLLDGIVLILAPFFIAYLVHLEERESEANKYDEDSYYYRG